MVGNTIMDAITQTDFPDLRAEYKPKAIYLEDADTVEYVKMDVACVYRRIDGFLTLALDLKSRELIGFRFKGFKNFSQAFEAEIQAGGWRLHFSCERHRSCIGGDLR